MSEQAFQGEWLSRDVEATLKCGEHLGRLLCEGDVLGLIGQLGAGKTQLVRGLAMGMGLDERAVSSPTYVLMQEYEPAESAAAGEQTLALVHVDAYRLGGEAEFVSGMWGNNGADVRRGAAVVIEWADVVERALGEDVLWLTLEHDPHGRRIAWSCHGTWRQRSREVAQAFTH